MPSYTYKCEAGHVEETFVPGLGPVRAICPKVGCNAAARIVISTAAQFKFTRALKMTGEPEYREDLARFRGDPRAYVKDRRDLKNLIDQTKREVEAEGGYVRPVSEAAIAPGQKDPLDEAADADLLQEAYDEAVRELSEED